MYVFIRIVLYFECRVILKHIDMTNYHFYNCSSLGS